MKTVTKYSYKALWTNPKDLKEKKLMPYSSMFLTKKECSEWYKNFGLNLERIFGRKLVFTETECRIEQN